MGAAGDAEASREGSEADEATAAAAYVADGKVEGGRGRQDSSYLRKVAFPSSSEKARLLQAEAAAQLKQQPVGDGGSFHDWQKMEGRGKEERKAETA